MCTAETTTKGKTRTDVNWIHLAWNCGGEFGIGTKLEAGRQKQMFS